MRECTFVMIKYQDESNQIRVCIISSTTHWWLFLNVYTYIILILNNQIRIHTQSLLAGFNFYVQVFSLLSLSSYIYLIIHITFSQFSVEMASLKVRVNSPMVRYSEDFIEAEYEYRTTTVAEGDDEDTYTVSENWHNIYRLSHYLNICVIRCVICSCRPVNTVQVDLSVR